MSGSEIQSGRSSRVVEGSQPTLQASEPDGLELFRRLDVDISYIRRNGDRMGTRRKARETEVHRIDPVFADVHRLLGFGKTYLGDPRVRPIPARGGGPAVYDAVLQIAYRFSPAIAIPALLQNGDRLPAETMKAILAEGQRIGRAMPPRRERAELLVAVAEKQPAAERPALLIDALDSALSLETVSGQERTDLLKRIFRLWKDIGFAGLNDGPARLSSILVALAANRRPEFLNDLGAILPLVSHESADAVQGTYEAVRDVCYSLSASQ